MGYTWTGMKKISWDEVKDLDKKGELVGCFYLYDDESEGMIEADYNFDDIKKHYECGGEFGIEK